MPRGDIGGRYMVDGEFLFYGYWTTVDFLAVVFSLCHARYVCCPLFGARFFFGAKAKGAKGAAGWGTSPPVPRDAVLFSKE